MKKIFFGMLAIVAMVATSCQQDVDLGVKAGETAIVSLNVGTPTRAYSDGTTATTLQYAVYDAAGNYLSELAGSKEIYGSTTIELKLVTGNQYDIICWADNDAAPYTVDLAAKTISIDYSNVACNDETLDAFYKKQRIAVKGAQSETIELKRPFAQINIGTADYEASRKAGYVPTQSAVTVKGVYSTLNLWDGTVADEVDVNFATSDIKKDEVFPVPGNEYMAMNYVLVNEKELVDVIFTYTDGADAKTRTVGSVPVQRNHRTNIYGELITSDVTINVEIAPEYMDPAHEADALFLAAAVGGEVTLTEDVVLSSALLVQANLAINLAGHTISNPNGYAIENSADLTISGDGEISGMGGIRSNGGKITINGGTYTGASDWNTGTYQHILKAVDTEVVINGGTFDATLGGMTNAMINVSENSVVTINGGTFKNVNGVIPQFAPYMFTYEKNGKLIINDGAFYGGWRFNGETATTDIYGGNFTVSYDGQSFHANSTHVLTIYGGTFSLANGGKLDPAKHLAAGHAVIEKDGLFVVAAAANNAETLATAIANGGLVTLTGDITTSEAIEIPAGTTATIDLNGKNIIATSTDAIVARDGVNLTISGNGKVESHAAPIRAIGGKVVVEGGEFTQTGDYFSTPSTLRYSVDSREGGEIIVKGGTFNTINGMINVSANSSVVIEGGIFNNTIQNAATRHFAYIAGTLTIKGGEFNNVANTSAGGTFFCGAGANGKVVVEGGKFSSLWNNGSKNNIWESYFGGSIEIKGGIFNHNGGIKAQVIDNTDAATKDAYPYMAK